MDELPTNLVDVTFFDFVFGRDLGSGSFATVRCGVAAAPSPFFSRLLPSHVCRAGLAAALLTLATPSYAKLIRKGSSLSHWREFALKQFDMERAREHQFDAAIRREVEVMQRLSHPNVCRLLGSFA